MEQRTTFVHAQSDTHGYTLLLEPAAAGEGSVCVHRNHPLITPCGAPSPAVGILVQKSTAGRDASGKKYIACETDGLLYTSLNWKAYCFFFTPKSGSSLCHLLFFHPCQIPFQMSNQASPLWDIGKTRGWFSLYETEKLTLCWDSWGIAVSSFSLSAAPSWMSGIHRYWGRLMFAWILKAGCLLGMNEYPATVAQLCLLKSKSNLSGH